MKRAAAFAFFVVGGALAQARPPRVIPPSARPAELPPSGDLGARFGLSAAARLLASPDADERLRGVERLSAIDSPEASEALVRAMDPGSPLVRDDRARLFAIRALAAHAGEEGPRGVLLRSMSEALPPDRSAMAELIGKTASLGLARHGGPRGAEVLAAVVRQGGRLGEVAAAALLAHPPASIEPLAGPKAPLSVEVARLLGALGDLRALPWLRVAVRFDEPNLREAALVALARLGDQEATVIARGFAGSADPRAKLAAARALSIVAPEEARTLVAGLLSAEATRREALALAEELGGAALTTALVPLAAAGPLDDRRRAAMALGLAPSDAAARALVGLLGDGEVAPTAVLSLGLARGDAAARALAAVSRDDARSGAFRATLVRALALSADFPADDRSLPIDVRAFAAAAQRGARPSDDELLASPALASAVALGLSSRGPRALAELDRAFVRADGAVEQALAVVLLGPSAAPTAKLWALVESRGAAAPIAVRALAARDEADSQKRLEAIARGTDPVLRRHVVLGLASRAGDGREGRIASMYALERDRDVRLAIVRGLAREEGALARSIRALARDLDPDAEVRRAASTRPRAASAPGDLVTVVGAASLAQVRVERPDGLALPAIVGTDGLALVPRVASGIGHASFARVSP